MARTVGTELTLLGEPGCGAAQPQEKLHGQRSLRLCSSPTVLLFHVAPRLTALCIRGAIVALLPLSCEPGDHMVGPFLLVYDEHDRMRFTPDDDLVPVSWEEAFSLRGG